MDMLSQLQSHPLFATFNPEQLAEVVRVGSPVTYQPGQLSIRSDEAGEIFGVLISGKLEAVRGHGTDQPQRLGVIQPGECFGEMSLLTGSASGTDLVAAEVSQAVVFVQEAIAPLIAMNREAVGYLTRLVTRRLAPGRERVAPPRPAAARYSLGASTPMRVLAISSRRRDLRYRYYDPTSEEPLAAGSFRGLGDAEAVHYHDGPKGHSEGRLAPATHDAAVAAVIASLTAPDEGLLGSAGELSVIGHRVCHGGPKFDGPAAVTDEVKAEIRRLAELAPMENPYNLLGIEAFEAHAPGVGQVAVFDTAFHLTMPAAATRYALPDDLTADGELRRFGCHGISHEGAARDASGFLGINFDALKILSCHLGTGASVAAIDHGRSVDSSMGLTPLEGLVMATRPGDLDPGLLLHLVARRGMDAKELEQRLYNDSGLLGLSGVSGDVRAVLAAAEEGDPRALLAIQVYCRRARKYLAGYVGLLGGPDAMLFTGGVGQNAPGVRARICQGLEWMGIVLDEQRNRSAQVGPGEVSEISRANSRVRVLIVGGNEGHTIARQAVREMTQRSVTDVMRRHHRLIPISTSAHHVHLAGEHVEALFGPGHTLTWHADLTQPGQFACEERVALIGPKGRIDRVRVLGPERPRTQVEISRTEEYKLGIDAPLRMSGDLDGTPEIVLEGPAGQVHLDCGVICAMRHVHMSPQDAMEFAVRDRDIVRVRIPGERSLIFGDVMVRVSDDYQLDMHIDTDEANAAELSEGTMGELDSIQQRA